MRQVSASVMSMEWADGAQSALGLHALPDDVLAHVLAHLPSTRD